MTDSIDKTGYMHQFVTDHKKDVIFLTVISAEWRHVFLVIDDRVQGWHFVNDH